MGTNVVGNGYVEDKKRIKQGLNMKGPNFVGTKNICNLNKKVETGTQPPLLMGDSYFQQFSHEIVS